MTAAPGIHSVALNGLVSIYTNVIGKLKAELHVLMNIKSIFGGRIDPRNSWLKQYLDTTVGIRTKLKKFQAQTKGLSKETVHQYFDEFRDVFNFAQSYD